MLTLDAVAETESLDPRAVVAVGLRATYETLREAVEYGRWHVAAALTDEEIVELSVELLAPPLLTRRVPPFGKAVGGVALVLPEVDQIAPRTPRPEISALWKRGRHYGLQIAAATQRPHECGRIVSAQADTIVAYRQHEPRDLAYLERVMGPGAGARIESLRDYHYLRYTASTGDLAEYDPADQIVEQ